MQRSSNSLRMFAYQHRKRGTREPPCRILVARIRSRVFKARLCVHPSFGRWAVWLRVYPACAPEFWSMGYLVTRAPFHNARVRGSAVEEAGRPRCTRCTQSMKWKLANRYSKVAKSGEKEKIYVGADVEEEVKMIWDEKDERAKWAAKTREEDRRK